MAIEDSPQGYPDSALIEVCMHHFTPTLYAHCDTRVSVLRVAVLANAQGIWLQSADCQERASPYDTNSSRSLITIGQSSSQPSECVHVAPEGTREMLYRNRACLGNRIPSEEYQEERPLEFQAKCIVVLIEQSSRKALLEMLIAAGRVLDDPLRLTFNYTTSLSPDPDLSVSSMNCAVAHLIYENYKRDAVGQELQNELASLRNQLEIKNAQVQLFERTVNGLAQYRPPGAPPPPSPPPRPDAPPGMLAPPIPPRVVSFDTRLQQLRADAASLESAIVTKSNEIGGPCVSSATNTCGRTSEAAPDPWLTKDGQRCAGYDTREALEGSFCAHWGSPVRLFALSYFGTNALMFVCMCGPCVTEQCCGCGKLRSRGTSNQCSSLVLQRSRHDYRVLPCRRSCHSVRSL